jgi:hypothetical protein
MVRSWCGRAARRGAPAPRRNEVVVHSSGRDAPRIVRAFLARGNEKQREPAREGRGRARPNPCARIGWDTMRQSSRPRDERLPWHGARRVTAAGVAGEGRWSAKRVPRFGRFVRFRAVVVWREAKLLRARRRGPRLTWT